jgi:hypothetical protein
VVERRPGVAERLPVEVEEEPPAACRMACGAHVSHSEMAEVVAM